MKQKIVLSIFTYFFIYLTCYSQDKYNIVCKDFTFEQKPYTQGKILRNIFEVVVTENKYPFKLLNREKMDEFFETLQEEKNLAKDLSSELKSKLQLASVDYFVTGDLNENIGTDNYTLIIDFIKIAGYNVTEKLPMLITFSRTNFSNTETIKNIFEKEIEFFVKTHFVDNKLFEDKDSLNTKAALNHSTLSTNNTSSNNNLDSNKFNTNPQDLPTLMVTNASKNKNCNSQPGDGCWNTIVAADPGDTIAVQVYFHNSTPYRADSTTLSIQPQISQKSTYHTFVGGVASLTLERSVANATVITTLEETLSFIPGSLRMYKNGSANAYQVIKQDDLFKIQGLNIGNVSPGWQNQGTLVAFYVVSK